MLRFYGLPESQTSMADLGFWKGGSGSGGLLNIMHCYIMPGRSGGSTSALVRQK